MDLTYNQTELFSHGRYFKNILSEGNIELTSDFQEDPEKLIEYYSSSKAAREVLDKHTKDNSSVSLVGATKEDYKRLGLDKESRSLNLSEEVKKHGGRLEMEDMIKIQRL